MNKKKPTETNVTLSKNEMKIVLSALKFSLNTIQEAIKDEVGEDTQPVDYDQFNKVKLIPTMALYVRLSQQEL
jgi:hypothetical protein